MNSLPIQIKLYIKDHPFTDTVDYENWKDYQYETKIKQHGEIVILEEGPRLNERLTGYGRRVTYRSQDDVMVVEVCPRWHLRHKTGFVLMSGS